MNIIEFKNVTEKFKLYKYKQNSLLGHVVGLFTLKERDRTEFIALDNINLSINKGETIGIIGENGSGKTTLLKLIAGILKPDEGSVKVHGRVSALFELGVGFHPELTGRENIYLNGILMGLSKKHIGSSFNEIVRFAELEDFIDSPIETYSTGMCMRLGFAIAASMEAEVLLIDEALAVGDAAFQNKCLNKLKEFKQKGMTIIFISHDMEIVSKFCDRVICLKNGRIVKDGLANNTIYYYLCTAGDKKCTAILKHRPLELIFNNGKAALLWHDIILTNSLSIYTSFSSNGLWNDSTYHVGWEIQKVNDKYIVANGIWERLPVKQIWRMQFIEDNAILWYVEMHVSEKISIEKMQANVMLRPEYNTWNSNGKNGVFPEKFNDDYFGDWESLSKETAEQNMLKVDSIKKDSLNLPSVILEFSKQDMSGIANIVNSDSMHNGRVLQYLKINGDEGYMQGCHRYFRGKIRVSNE